VSPEGDAIYFFLAFLAAFFTGFLAAFFLAAIVTSLVDARVECHDVVSCTKKSQQNFHRPSIIRPEIHRIIRARCKRATRLRSIDVVAKKNRRVFFTRYMSG
jgi:hypothetical protein